MDKSTGPAAVEDLGIYERVKLLILQGELPSGDPLVERSLADRLGVSRTPVRETILRLEREGLVRIVGRKGAFVAEYTIEDVIEIYQLREGIEGMAARLSCGRIDPERIAYFEENLRRYRTDPSLREEQPGEWQKLGRDFHHMFIAASENKRLIRTVESLKDQIELFRGITMTKGRAFARSQIDEHLAILKAFRENSPDRAEKAVREHIRNGLQHRIALLHPTSR
jgi:DNA-binding GntR family transcriptional regulator